MRDTHHHHIGANRVLDPIAVCVCSRPQRVLAVWVSHNAAATCQFGAPDVRAAPALTVEAALAETIGLKRPPTSTIKAYLPSVLATFRQE
jgi:hypothetical protein